MLSQRRAGRTLIGAVALAALVANGGHAQALRIGAPAPDFAGGPWINSPPLPSKPCVAG